MTNAEKFKEIFGFGVCAQTRCNECPLSRPDKCAQVEFWDAEYQEPKQKIFDYLTTTGIAMLDGEKIANAEWKQAIEDIKAEINGQSYAYYDSEEIIDIIDKHTKELM